MRIGKKTSSWIVKVPGKYLPAPGNIQGYRLHNVINHIASWHLALAAATR